MGIANFDDLLLAAREQSEPQRLLFVFVNAVLPDDCTTEQRAGFEAGHGGALAPLMYVDKSPDELKSFADIVDESHQIATEWVIVFVGSLSGCNGRAPAGEDVDHSLQHMIESIKTGSFGTFIPFDRRGQTVQFE